MMLLVCCGTAMGGNGSSYQENRSLRDGNTRFWETFIIQTVKLQDDNYVTHNNISIQAQDYYPNANDSTYYGVDEASGKIVYNPNDITDGKHRCYVAYRTGTKGDANAHHTYLDASGSSELYYNADDAINAIHSAPEITYRYDGGYLMLSSPHLNNGNYGFMTTNMGYISGVYSQNAYNADISTNMGNHRDVGVAWYEPVDLDGDAEAEGIFVSKEVYP